MQFEGLVYLVEFSHCGDESCDTNTADDEDVMGGHAVGFDAAIDVADLDDCARIKGGVDVGGTTSAIVVKGDAEGEEGCVSGDDGIGSFQAIGQLDQGIATDWNGGVLWSVDVAGL